MYRTIHWISSIIINCRVGNWKAAGAGFWILVLLTTSCHWHWHWRGVRCDTDGFSRGLWEQEIRNSKFDIVIVYRCRYTVWYCTLSTRRYQVPGISVIFTSSSQSHGPCHCHDLPSIENFNRLKRRRMHAVYTSESSVIGTHFVLCSKSLNSKLMIL